MSDKLSKLDIRLAGRDLNRLVPRKLEETSLFSYISLLRYSIYATQRPSLCLRHSAVPNIPQHVLWAYYLTDNPFIAIFNIQKCKFRPLKKLRNMDVLSLLEKNQYYNAGD